MSSVRLIAIDPYDCGCTECCTGEYKSLRSATDDDIADLLAGRLRNNLNSDEELEVSVKYATEKDRDGRTTLRVDSVEVTYHVWNGLKRTWDPDPYRAGLV
jgi:hypothetical protein